jgi:hypothetical protein
MQASPINLHFNWHEEIKINENFKNEVIGQNIKFKTAQNELTITSKVKEIVRSYSADCKKIEE